MGFLGGDKVIVGYDLGNRYSQISFSLSETGDVQTLSQVAGTEHYNIPTVLCKRSGVNQWFYGKEALRYSEEEQGILVENLLELALDGEPVLIEGESFAPEALLALFLKRSLGLLNQASSGRISALMITCETLDGHVLEVLNRVLAASRLKADRIVFQNYAESYYSYMLHQPGELWSYQSLLLFYSGSRIRAYSMECNRRTDPVVVFIEERDFPFSREPFLSGTENIGQQEAEALDRELLELSGEVCEGKIIGSVFLIGDGFGQEWMRESLRYLCRNRRVFQGNNLFSKGACFGMQERMRPSEAGTKHVFLGSDKLKANVGMKIMRQGEESYYALLDAGVNWYEAGHDMEFYLRDGNEIALTVTPLTGKNGKLARIVLEDFPGTIARLRGSFYLEAENLLAVEIEDMGFGEIRPATGRVWKERLELY